MHKLLGVIALVFLPLLLVQLVFPGDSPVVTAVHWYFALTFWPSPLVLAGLYVAVRAWQHRRIHQRIEAADTFVDCPRCLKHDVYHGITGQSEPGPFSRVPLRPDALSPHRPDAA